MNVAETDMIKEFEVDTGDAATLGTEATLERYRSLMDLVGMLTGLAREVHELRTNHEEQQENLRRQTRKARETMALLVDELRRLVEDAVRSLRSDPEPSTAPSETPVARPGVGWGIWSLFGYPGQHMQVVTPPPLATDNPPPAENRTTEWLKAFGTLLAMMVDKLERMDVHHVPLLGQDLKTYTYEGQLVKTWVAIKNRSDDGRLIVKDEVRGLWIYRSGKEMEPVLKAEVTV